MPILAAQNCFKKGLAALVEDRPAEAIEHFRAAMEIEKQRCVHAPEMRYLSYYGLSMARVHGVSRDARDACELAARQAPYDPALQLNLCRIYELAGRTSRALECLERARALAPDNLALTREFQRLERRERPVLPSLGRAHPLNRSLGRLRAWLRGSRAAGAPASRPREASRIAPS